MTDGKKYPIYREVTLLSKNYGAHLHIFIHSKLLLITFLQFRIMFFCE